MKLFYFLAFLAVSVLHPAIAQESHVPAPGSVWESVTVYPATQDGGEIRSKKERVHVDRLVDGRPVFAGKMFGIDGEIIESTEGTIVYALECKKDVLPRMLLPPPVPNQCVWGVCSSPPVGQMFIRRMTIYAPLFACQPQEAAYSFNALRTGTDNGKPTTVGKAVITFNGTQRASWESHIKDGEGEVFAEYPGSVTTYENISVTLIPYLPSEKPVLSLAR